MHFRLRHLALSALLASIGVSDTNARADVPSGISEEAFTKACGVLKAAASCEECECKAVATTDSGDVDRETWPEMAYALVVKVATPLANVTPERTAPFVARHYMLVGSASKLQNAGLLVNANGAPAETVYVEVKAVKTSQFNDVCLTCDHENAGLVHLFDLVMERTSIVERDSQEQWETVDETRALVACFGRTTPHCFATPLGLRTHTQRQPQAPGDKPKTGKRSTWKRGWKIGGHNKMQVVLGPIRGNLAGKTKKGAIGTDANAFNFADLQLRASAKRLPLR
jgi:hypothetical protein